MFQIGTSKGPLRDHKSDVVGLRWPGILDQLPAEEAPEWRRSPQFFDLAICKIV
jgi:hypothetical protein